MNPIIWVPGMVAFFATLLLGWRVGFGLAIIVWLALLVGGALQ